VQNNLENVDGLETITILKQDYNALVEVAIAADSYVKSQTSENWEQLLDVVFPQTRTAVE
jgi:hypothetical protein